MAGEGAIYRQQGDTWLEEDLGTAVTVGDIQVKSGKVVIAKDSVAVGGDIEWSTCGVYSAVPKLTADVVVEGDPLYWNDSNKEVQLAATATFFGYAREDADGTTSVIEAQLVNDTVRP